jgi:uncharacterized protein YegP (UPF0339 family)
MRFENSLLRFTSNGYKSEAKSSAAIAAIIVRNTVKHNVVSEQRPLQLGFM